MQKPATRRAYIVRSFRDAGTTKRFKAGSTVPMSEGAFLNYEAAGLVQAATEEEARPSRRRRARGGSQD